MSRYVIDLETNGFLLECDKILCAGVRDIDSDYNELFVNGRIGQFLDLVSNEEHEFIGHNIYSFDARVINKLYGVDVTLTNKIHDTFIMGQVLYGDLKDQDFKNFSVNKKYIGSHSLAAWGERINSFKQEYTGGFYQYNEVMGEYCLQDTKVTKDLFLFLESKIAERTWK